MVKLSHSSLIIISNGKKYPLDNKSVLDNAPTEIGVYLLGRYHNRKFYIGYVGRSDISIKERLFYHPKRSSFSHFCFKTVKTPIEAYYLENALLNLHKDNPMMMNLNKPGLPRGMNLKEVRKLGLELIG